MTITERVARVEAGRFLWLLTAFAAPLLSASQDASLEAILQRLARLEEQNLSLQEEVNTLRSEMDAMKGPLAPAGQPTVEERLSVAESRVEEQAQTKVEASQRFPIRITGMALFNAFYNGKNSGGRSHPTIASLDPGRRTVGGTLTQSVIGLDFRGPSLPGGGKMSGSLFMDLYGGASSDWQYVRLRTGSIDFDWKNTSFLVGQEKPIISPREPNSLANVATPPLANAGNLWFWRPQARIEQRLDLSEFTKFRAQAGVFQMEETAAIVPPQFAGSLEPARPAFQGRFEIAHLRSNGVGIEIAPGVHAATSHIAGAGVPSRLFSVDWLIRPVEKIEFTGMFFRGRNLAGLGALRQSFQIIEPGVVNPVRSMGGWGQLTFLATDRVTFNLLGGQHDDRDRDLPHGGFGKNQSYGANVMVRIAPNVIISFQSLRTWTTYVGEGTRRNTSHDLGVAYLF